MPHDEETHRPGDYSLHMDNLRRFVDIERKVDDNTAVTKKLSDDVADLLAMWRDVGVVFKWLKKTGAVLIWLGKVGTAVAALWALWRFGIQPPSK